MPRHWNSSTGYIGFLGLHLDAILHKGFLYSVIESKRQGSNIIICTGKAPFDRTDDLALKSSNRWKKFKLTTPTPHYHQLFQKNTALFR